MRENIVRPSYFYQPIASFVCCVLQALEERNNLRKKLGKNKIVPQAPTDLDVKIEREETAPKGSPTSWDIFTVEKKKEEIVVEDKEKTSKATSQENAGSNEKAGGDASLCELNVFCYSSWHTTTEPICAWWTPLYWQKDASICHLGDVWFISFWNAEQKILY